MILQEPPVRHGVAKHRRLVSEADYLEAEPDRQERHEYINGEVRAMAGASDSHEGVALWLSSLLLMHLRGKPCRVYKGDMKLRIQPRQQRSPVVFYYPDIMVVCDASDNHELYKTKPRLVIEVLSKDRGRDLVEKLAHYREIETLAEYATVSQNAERPEVQIFRRRSDFEPETVTEGELVLESVGLRLVVSELYDY